MLKLALDTLKRLRYSLPTKFEQVQIEITNQCNVSSLVVRVKDLAWSVWTRQICSC